METIGQTLKKARESKKMTVTDVAHATRAMVKCIEAIEADDFSAFPAPIYATGFIKFYAECVGLNPQPLVQAFRNRKAGAKTNLPPVDRKFSTIKFSACWHKSLSHWLAVSWQAALKKICWPSFKAKSLSISAIRLPVETWKTILAVAGMIVLVVVAVGMFWWYASWSNGVDLSLTSRWLQEPPAPYLPAE